MDVRAVNKRVIEQFRAGGEIEGMHRDRLLLLTTVGAKTGHSHTTPMMFQQDGDRLVVVAANAGAPRDPQWYRNLVRQPRVTVEVGHDSYGAVASVIAGPERDRRWAALTAAYPFLADYERQAGRVIPVIGLARPADGG
ncbi:MAG: nitroreductase/quinone reductase family protein [Streptosporangiaceae bacterium]